LPNKVGRFRDFEEAKPFIDGYQPSFGIFAPIILFQFGGIFFYYLDGRIVVGQINIFPTPDHALGDEYLDCLDQKKPNPHDDQISIKPLSFLPTSEDEVDRMGLS
jgi:hypothetical protein